MILFWVKKVREKEVVQTTTKKNAIDDESFYWKIEQRYNGPGKKSDASTNKNKKIDWKTKLKSKIPTGQESNEEL
jgi:ATP-dependent Zn protease